MFYIYILLFSGENRFTIETFMKTGPLAMLSIFERLTGSDQPLYAQVGFCAEWLLDNICKTLNTRYISTNLKEK